MIVHGLNDDWIRVDTCKIKAFYLLSPQPGYAAPDSATGRAGWLPKPDLAQII